MSVLQPKKPAWLFASAAAALLALAVFLLLVQRRPWDPARAGGLVFGIAAALLYTIEILYPLRRRLLGFPFGNAQRWIQFHIWGGCLGFWFVLIHEGFRWPSGTMGWLLLLLSVWATLSGLGGVWLQKWIPAALSTGLQVEALFERIPELLNRLRDEADGLAKGSSEMLERFYGESVRPALAGVSPSWSYLVNVRAGRDDRLAPFVRLAPYLAEEEKTRLEDLRALYTEKLELDAQYTLQRILRLWIYLHVPPSALLYGLMLFHIGTSLSYQ
jgi:hypothetical protein